MRSHRILAVGVTALLLWAVEAAACECERSLPPRKELAESNAVFAGEVIKVSRVKVKEKDELIGGEWERLKVQVRLRKVLKGSSEKLKVGDIADVLTGTGGGDCGYHFKEGQSYLVYARGSVSELETDICTRTRLLEGAEDEILELEGKPPKTNAPAKAPELILKGGIKDAGYHGFVFDFKNHLHERIFYGRMKAQIWRNEKWEFYPANYGVDSEEEPTEQEKMEWLEMQRADEESKKEVHPIQRFRRTDHLDRIRSEPVFTAVQATSFPWRIGFQFIPESKYETGATVTDSEQWVWSQRMDVSTSSPMLNFTQAFRGSGMIPFPFGTNEGGKR